MENLSKLAGYLKGLMEGAELEESPNGKLLSGMVSLLEALAQRVESLDELLADLNDYVESIDDDLTELENDRPSMDGFEDLDEDELPFDEYEEGDDASEERLQLMPDEEAEEPEDAGDEEETALAGCLCSACGRMFFVNLKDGPRPRYICPHCGQTVEPQPLTPENAPIAKPADEEDVPF